MKRIVSTVGVITLALTIFAACEPASVDLSRYDRNRKLLDRAEEAFPDRISLVEGRSHTISFTSEDVDFSEYGIGLVTASNFFSIHKDNDSTFTLTGNAEGEGLCTFTYLTLTKDVPVTVAPDLVETISVPEDFSVDCGNTAKFAVRITPEDVSRSQIQVSSDNSKFSVSYWHDKTDNTDSVSVYAGAAALARITVSAVHDGEAYVSASLDVTGLKVVK